MKKHLWIILLALLPVLLAAQSLNDGYMFPGDETWEDPVYPVTNTPKFGLAGILGTLMADGTAYTQLRIKPEMSIWKVGIGLDLDLLINGAGQLRQQDWDNWKDILGKVLYLRFADRSDSLYFKVGSIPDYTLGHGLIFDDYSNMLRYPDYKPLGGYVGANTNSFGFGFEFYTHDISKNEVIAARASFEPLQILKLPLLKKLRLGLNVGADRNPYGKYPDSDHDGYPDVYDKFPQDKKAWLDTDDDGVADNVDIDLNGNSILDDPALNPYVNEVFPNIANIYPDYPFDTAVYPDSAARYVDNPSLWIYSLDYDLPLIKSGDFSLSNYAEFAVMEHYGSGLIFPGLAARVGIFDLKLEMRSFGARFLPSYFNNLYDEQRCQSVVTVSKEDGHRSYFLNTKQALLAEVKPGLGWFGYLKGNIGRIGYLKVAYQDLYGDELKHGKSLWGKLTIMPGRLPKLKEASLYYAQTDVDKVDWKNLRCVNAEISSRLVYGYSDNLNLVLKYSEYYSDLNADGLILGRDEVVEAVNFGVEFQL